MSVKIILPSGEEMYVPIDNKKLFNFRKMQGTTTNGRYKPFKNI